MRILLINLIFALLIFADSKIVDTKIVNGVEYYVVKSKADVMAVYTSDRSKFLGKDLVFKNLNGKTSYGKASQKELEKCNINDKVDIFFVITKGERDKLTYKIYFNKDKALLHLQKLHEGIDEKKISTRPIYGFKNRIPLLKLVYKDNSYQYVPAGLNVELVFMIIIIVFIIFIYITIFIKTLNIGGVLIVLSMIGMTYLMVVHNTERKVFDMERNQFYSESNGYIKFDNIYAFQILKNNVCTSTKLGGVMCNDRFSLNIVLKDYNRLNLVVYYDYTDILDDAKILSEALHKPILDIVNTRRL